MSIPVIGKKGGSKNVDKTQTRGVPLDPGPHLAIVKHNADATKRGRISVWTEILGDPRENPNTWVQVQYASPYISQTEYKAPENDYDNVQHTAGMWVPSPAVGTKVLIVFPSGNKNNGLWFACVPDRYNNHAFPGLASSSTFDALTDTHGEGGSSEFKHRDGKYDKYQPVGDFIETHQRGATDYHNTPKNIHAQEKPINYFLGRIYKEQGLSADLIRGHTTSSAQRESPSELFGISTKGRRYNPDKTSTLDEKALFNKLDAGNLDQLTSEEKVYLDGIRRKPGHTFVMDDGEITGENELIRMRSASGHQVLLNDSSGVVYIGNATGTVWMEFGNTGSLDIFSQDTVNVRTKNMNFHADQNMNFYAGQDINMVAGNQFQSDAGILNLKSKTGGVKIDSSAGLDLKSSSALNIDGGGVNIQGGSDVKIDAGCIDLGSGAGSAGTVTSLPTSKKHDTIRDSKGFWKSYPVQTKTISTRLPTHEPFHDRDIKIEATPIIKPEVNTTESPDTVYPEILTEEEIRKFRSAGEPIPGNVRLPDGSIPPPPPQAPTAGPTSARASIVEPSDRLTRASAKNQPIPGDSVGTLSTSETQRLMAVIGQHESNGVYTAENEFGYIGKYQMGLAALEDAGYVKPGTFRAMKAAGYSTGKQNNMNAVLNDPNVWVGDYSKTAFLADGYAQEQAMERIMKQNYKTLNRTGAIDGKSSNSDVAGKLMAAHLKGAGGVTTWAKTGVSSVDGFGTSIGLYYNIGRSAIQSA